MTYLDSEHCRSGVHCSACRQLDSGRWFRRHLARRFSDIDQVDFACPDGKPWLSESFYIDKPTADLLALINSLPETDDKCRLLRSLAAQITDLMRSTGCACRDKAAFLARMRSKLTYYWQLYGPSATNLQPSETPHASTLQKPVLDPEKAKV